MSVSSILCVANLYFNHLTFPPISFNFVVSVYRKWSEKYFHECYRAFKEGRTVKDPSSDWYEREVLFFDEFVIPLSKKLKDCGVFGVAGDEYFNYANNNRQEWEAKGEETVRSYVWSYHKREEMMAQQAQRVSNVGDEKA